MLLLAKATTFLLLLLSPFVAIASVYAQKNDWAAVINENSGIIILVVGIGITINCVMVIYGIGKRRGRESEKLDHIVRTVDNLTIEVSSLRTEVGRLRAELTTDTNNNR